MRTNKPSLLLFMLLLLVAGCAAPEKTESDKVQGTWKGIEINGPETRCSVTVSGDQIYYRGEDLGEWYKGTLLMDTETHPKRFKCRIDEAPLPAYVGVEAIGIYKLEGNKLIIAAYEPGSTIIPASFKIETGMRGFELTKIDA